MTLVVYSNRKFYADDCVLVDPDAYHFRKDKKACKIHHDKEIAIAMCGNLPWERHRQKVIAGVSRIVFYAEIGKGNDSFQESFKTEKDAEHFKKISGLDDGATYLVATKHSLYLLTNSGLSRLRWNCEYVYGSGNTFFSMCRKAGMSIEDSYKEVSQYARTVGELAQVVDLNNLTDVVINVTDAMLKSNPAKYKELAGKILESAQIKRKEEAE